MHSNDCRIARAGFVAGLCLLTMPALAEEPHHPAPYHLEHGPQHLSMFLGGTEVDEEGIGTAFTLGVDYEYRLGRRLGVGGLVEHAFGDLDSTSLLGVVDLHICHGLALQLGPGVELGEEEDVFITRVGALYEFERNAYTVSPQVHYDIHDGAKDAVVFGLAVGHAF